MKTLDRYIIGQFLLNFGILFLVVMSLFVVVDFIVDVDEFLKAAKVHQKFWLDNYIVSLIATIADFYVPVVMLIYVFFNGLIVVAAMGFTLTTMLRNRELTAVIASGVSLYRVAAPLLVTGVLLSALTLPVQEFVLPKLAAKLTRSKSELSQPRKGLASEPIHYAAAGGGDLLSARAFNVNGDSGTLEDVRIIQRNEDGSQFSLVVAERATWDEAKQKWILTNGFYEKPQFVVQGMERGQAQKEEALTYQRDITPRVLLAKRDSNYANLLSLRDLQELMDNPALSVQHRSKITLIVWSRFSLMVLNVLVLVMGLPFFLKRVPGNMLASSLKAAGVCIGAWGGGLLLLQLPAGSFPVVVAWLPVIIYVPVAALLLVRVES